MPAPAASAAPATTTLRAVEAGLGVGCPSRISLVDEIARKRVKTYRVPQRDLRRRFYFVLHRQKHVTATIRAWIALCGSTTSQPLQASSATI